MDTMTEIRRTFFEECAEQLVELETGLSAFEAGTADAETIGVVYRAVHSIKGGAGAFELKELVHFALTYERVLNEIRSERLVLDAGVMAVLRRAQAMLVDLVDVAREKDRLLKDLRAFVPGAEEEAAAAERENAAGPVADEPTAAEDLGFTPVSVDFGTMFDTGEQRFRIFFRPRPELYANANESARLIRELLSLGAGDVSCDTSETPMLDALDPEGAFLSWTIELTTEAGEGAIREVFDFAEFDCDLEISRIEDEAVDDSVAFETDDPEMAALFARLQATG